jgi:hypothetical protein
MAVSGDRMTPVQWPTFNGLSRESRSIIRAQYYFRLGGAIIQRKGALP